MKQFHKKNPLGFALMWIGIYDTCFDKRIDKSDKSTRMTSRHCDSLGILNLV